LNHLDRIVNLVAREQSSFICNGSEISQLRPIGIKDIAEKIGLHPSTVSRMLHQVTVAINGKEFPISVLLPSSRIGSMQVREVVKELAQNPKYCDGKRWLFTAESLRVLLQDLTGQILARRTVSKYLGETGLQPGGMLSSPLWNGGKFERLNFRSMPSDEVRKAWTILQAPEGFPCDAVSEEAKQVAGYLEASRLEALDAKLEQLCAALTVEDTSLTEAFVSLADVFGFVLVPAEKSLMLKIEPWSPTLLYLMPGRGLILPSANILKGTKEGTREEIFSAYASVLQLHLRKMTSSSPMNTITEQILRQLLSLLAIRR
jgi:hypothetical protein